MPGTNPPARDAFADRLTNIEAELRNVAAWIQTTGVMPASTLAVAYRKAALALSGLTHIPVDTVTLDVGGNIASGNYVAPASGYYSVIGQVATTGSGEAIALIYINGTQVTDFSASNLESIVNKDLAQ